MPFEQGEAIPFVQPDPPAQAFYLAIAGGGGPVNLVLLGGTSIIGDIFVQANMARIDIDKLTEAELVDLNNRIVERLRFLNHMRAHADMLEFRIGDRVSFQPQGRAPVVGMLTRYNRKTVTVITDDGQHWNVSPQFVRRVESSVIDQSEGPNVVHFKPK